MSDNIAQRVQEAHYQLEEVQKEINGSVIVKLTFDMNLLQNFENDDSGHPILVAVNGRVLEKGEKFGPYLITDLVWATAKNSEHASLLITATRQ